MGNPIAPIDDLAYVIDYVRAAVVITTPEVAIALGPRLGELPHLRAILLVARRGDRATIPRPTVRDAGRVCAIAPSHRVARRRDRARPRARDAAADDPRATTRRSGCSRRGSTGRAKAAMHSHRDFAFNTEVYAKRTVGYREDDVTVSVPRLFFGYATGTNLMFPFAVGATVGPVQRAPDRRERSPRRSRRYRADDRHQRADDDRQAARSRRRTRARAASPASISRACASTSRPARRCPSRCLRRFMRALRRRRLRRHRLGRDVPHLLLEPPRRHHARLARHASSRATRSRSCPRTPTAPGAAPLPPGEIGVLWVKGDSVAHGYFQDRDKSWKTFHGHWCRTGDLFHIDERGYLWFSGRADDLFKVGGIWVAPLEVEECLLAHPRSSVAAVIGGEDDGLVKPKAFVVVRPEARDRIDAGRQARARRRAEGARQGAARRSTSIRAGSCSSTTCRRTIAARSTRSCSSSATSAAS